MSKASFACRPRPAVFLHLRSQQEVITWWGVLISESGFSGVCICHNGGISIWTTLRWKAFNKVFDITDITKQTFTPHTMQGFCEGVCPLYASMKKLQLQLDTALVRTAYFLFLYDEQESVIRLCSWNQSCLIETKPDYQIISILHAHDYCIVDCWSID